MRSKDPNAYGNNMVNNMSYRILLKCNKKPLFNNDNVCTNADMFQLHTVSIMTIDNRPTLQSHVNKLIYLSNVETAC